MEDAVPKEVREEGTRSREESVNVRICPEHETAAFYAGRSDGYRKALFDIAQIALIGTFLFCMVKLYHSSDD